MSDAVSSRLLDQRVRNRVIDVLELLGDGNAGVQDVGVAEYFNMFFDWADEPQRALSTYTATEVALLEKVLAVLLDALAATNGLNTVDEICDSGWPRRTAVVAQEAFSAMVARGRFREDVEEAEPGRD
ncbi:hypothetical protein [Kribbella shirazensis]|uniref:Uncharacterized protein n=1 Tax=Kribbella shirazensis TaxID=1105143 RepID=A0A7X5VEJ8_9ACTN|nr:hypothetical protein [Kribbella shirazensis]NIK59579.1 hypothetical protein [Kribbella shirazensis]